MAAPPLTVIARGSVKSPRAVAALAHHAAVSPTQPLPGPARGRDPRGGDAHAHLHAESRPPGHQPCRARASIPAHTLRSVDQRPPTDGTFPSGHGHLPFAPAARRARVE